VTPTKVIATTTMIALHEETHAYVQPITTTRVTFRIRLFDADDASVTMIWWHRHHPDKTHRLVMESLNIKETSSFCHGTLTSSGPLRYIRYVFEITSHGAISHYSPEGLTSHFPTMSFQYLYTNKDDVFSVPSWAIGATGYHIFVDRFDKTGDDNRDIVPWDSKPSRTNVFGGTLKGIEERLPYIKNLSVDVLILTPIFKASSNHKYDTLDYHAVDPTFGTTDDLKRLVEKAHSLGIKVILDGVFNHVGYHSRWFQDAVERGPASPFFDWFMVKGGKIDTSRRNYAMVGDYKWMPKLNHANPDVTSMLLDVGSSWINKADIDGWRLDVADEIPRPFWHAFSRHVKSHKQDILLIGESWKNPAEHLDVDLFHSTMNYPLRDAVIRFFITSSISAHQFSKLVEDILFTIPEPFWHVTYTLLGSHDTPRIRTLSKDNRDAQDLALAFLVSFVGMPVIFYGDETGLKGQNDPACRKSMPWNRLDDKRIKTTQDTLALRQSFPVLKDGTFSHIVFSDDLYGIIRENSQSRVLVVFNRGKTDQDIDVSDLGIVSTELHLQENRIHMKAGTFQIMRIQERMVSETSKT